MTAEKRIDARKAIEAEAAKQFSLENKHLLDAGIMLTLQDFRQYLDSLGFFKGVEVSTIPQQVYSPYGLREAVKPIEPPPIPPPIEQPRITWGALLQKAHEKKLSNWRATLDYLKTHGLKVQGNTIAADLEHITESEHKQALIAME